MWLGGDCGGGALPSQFMFCGVKLIDHQSPLVFAGFQLHYGDLTDSSCLVKLISEVGKGE